MSPENQHKEFFESLVKYPQKLSPFLKKIIKFEKWIFLSQEVFLFKFRLSKDYFFGNSFLVSKNFK